MNPGLNLTIEQQSTQTESTTIVARIVYRDHYFRQLVRPDRQSRHTSEG